MKRRGISEHEVKDVIKNPDQFIEYEKKRLVYQKKSFDRAQNKWYLFRVILEKSNKNVIVITVYKTSKIAKYWREK